MISASRTERAPVGRASAASRCSVQGTGDCDTETVTATTRIGFLIIAAGVVLLVLRAVNWVDTELADVASVIAIVIGAVAVAIDGEEADGPA